MRFLKSIFWISAWAGWAWLGVGLYRELPRALGAPVRRLPASPTIGGFVGETNRVAVVVQDKGFQTTTVNVYDAETGALVLAKPGGLVQDYLWRAQPTIRSLFVTRLPGERGEWALGLHRFDPSTGDWRRLTTKMSIDQGFHPERPWVAVAEWAEAEGQNPNRAYESRRITVVDWVTGEARPVCEIKPPAQLDGTPFFLDGPDRLAVPLYVEPDRRSFAGVERVLEIWELSDPPRLWKRMNDAPTLRNASYSLDGRIAFAPHEGEAMVEVYDLQAGGSIFSKSSIDNPAPEPFAVPRSALRAARGRWSSPPSLSPSGRMVLGGYPPTLWEIDTGRVVWRGGADDTARGASTVPWFLVQEQWGLGFKSWLSRLPYRTQALRETETGRVVLRLTPGDLQLSWNSSLTMAIAPDGAVYRAPAVNWMLLALCQAVLALPLVLAWTILRWRRRRWLRRATP